MERRFVTVFGGSGFVGRYIVKRLADAGYTVRVPTRNTERAKFLKPSGYLGQILPIHCDATDGAAVKEVVAGSEAVINLIGILFERGARSFDAMHVHVAKTIAGACKEHGVDTLLHMSALGADADSDARYARTKATGEAAVRDIMPSAVIFRPSVIFGPEDGFLNMFALMGRFSPVLPVVGAALPTIDFQNGTLNGDDGPKFQPVYVGDVAEAFMTALNDTATRAQTYELGGPKVYSFKEILTFLLKTTRQKALLVPVPFGLAKLKAVFLQMLPKPLLTTDQVVLLKSDNVISEGAKTFADLGIEPNTMEAVAPGYLKRHRPPRKSGEFRRFA